MNILIPDMWLREHLDTDATPKELKTCLSLCGPSVERIHGTGKDSVYDIEITTNRVDAFSVRGIAREAVAILPQFAKSARLRPYKSADFTASDGRKAGIDIEVVNDPRLCRRILAVLIDGVTVGESPTFIKKYLEMVGQRPLNNAIDITNYVMWELGHPLHAFDYDTLAGKKIIVREAKKGETAITLDGKTHTFRGGEVVFDNGSGEIVDLPGIMGTQNSVISQKTKRVLLWVEDIDSRKIRYSSMGLSIRSQAAVINEKHPDPELGYEALKRAAYFYQTAAGGRIVSAVIDIYPDKPVPKVVTLGKKLLTQYLGTDISDREVKDILGRLNFLTEIKNGTSGRDTEYIVTPPTYRAQDIEIAEDVIEEIARIYGYHNIRTSLPSGELPLVIPDPVFTWENEIKVRLRDWGYTEIYTYSMLSREQLERFSYDPAKQYRIQNVLLTDQEFMRPGLIPGLVDSLKQNLQIDADIRLFELSNTYAYRPGNLPDEREYLGIVSAGNLFRDLKGIAETVFYLFGIGFPAADGILPPYADPSMSIPLGLYGWIGMLNTKTAYATGLRQPVTVLELDFTTMVKHANRARTYVPVPKYPAVYEDLTFTVPPGFRVGPFIEALAKSHPLIHNIEFAGRYADTRTFHITYLDPGHNLTAEDIQPVRSKIMNIAMDKFGAKAKTIGNTA